MGLGLGLGLGCCYFGHGLAGTGVYHAQSIICLAGIHSGAVSSQGSPNLILYLTPTPNPKPLTQDLVIHNLILNPDPNPIIHLGVCSYA